MVKIRKPEWIEKENNIVIGCIIDDDFVGKYFRVHKYELIKSAENRRIIDWCFEYWKKYTEAPRQNIQKIWEEKQQTTAIPEDESQLIEKILAGLSGKYSENEADFNAEYQIQIAINYLRNRQIEESINLADQLSKQGKLDEAEKALSTISPIKSKSLLSELSDCSVTASKFLGEELYRPSRLISPWLNLQSLNMIYAERGIGKTMLSLSLAIALTRKNIDKWSCGPWEAKKPTGVLYVDGEMGEHDLQERIRLLSAPLGEESKTHPLIILSGNRLARQYRKQINIATEEWQTTISEFLAERPRIKCIVLDNLSALTPGRDENNKKEWDPINQWLISLRAMGLAVIFVHHAGKNKKSQRGTSGHDDAVDIVINLSKMKNERGARFWVNFEKNRNLAPGLATEEFSVQLTGNKKKLEWEEILTEN